MKDKKNINVLIADGLDTNKICLRVFLKFFGFSSITEVSSFENAMSKLHTKEYDVAFFNLNLITPNSINILESYRNWEQSNHHKTFLFAIKTEKEKLNTAKEFQLFDEIINDPLNQKKLYRSIRHKLQFQEL